MLAVSVPPVASLLLYHHTCLALHAVVLVKYMNRRFPRSCTYRMTVQKILKGRHLFNYTLTDKLRVNVQFPHNNCTKETDGCVRLDKGARYLIGAQVRVQRKRKSLLALLPSAFITADFSPAMIRKVARHPACAWFNGSEMELQPTPTAATSSAPPN